MELFLLEFYFDIIVDSHVVVKIIQRDLLYLLPGLPPMVTSYETVVQRHKQDTDTAEIQKLSITTNSRRLCRLLIATFTSLPPPLLSLPLATTNLFPISMNLSFQEHSISRIL